MGLRLIYASVGLTTVLSLGLLPAVSRADDPVAALTWTRDIEPLIRDRCLSCHADSGPALPRLETYEDVVANAAAVKAAVMSRKMPIWAPLRGITRYHDDPSLSPFQVSRVASWIESRRTRGVDPPVRALRPSRRPFVAPPGPSVEVRVDAPSVSADVQPLTLKLPEPRRVHVVAWRFDAGDQAMRQAIFKDDAGRVLWTWAAGDTGEVLPARTAFQLSPVFTVEMYRRPVNDDGRGTAPRPSTLRLWLDPKASRPLDVVTIPCKSALDRPGRVYALRPSSPGSSRVSVKDRRTGRVAAAFAPREYRLLRTYWLREPLTVRAARSLLVEGTGCSLDVVLSSPER